MRHAFTSAFVVAFTTLFGAASAAVVFRDTLGPDVAATDGMDGGQIDVRTMLVPPTFPTRGGAFSMPLAGRTDGPIRSIEFSLSSLEYSPPFYGAAELDIVLLGATLRVGVHSSFSRMRTNWLTPDIGEWRIPFSDAASIRDGGRAGHSVVYPWSAKWFGFNFVNPIPGDRNIWIELTVDLPESVPNVNWVVLLQDSTIPSGTADWHRNSGYLNTPRFGLRVTNEFIAVPEPSVLGIGIVLQLLGLRRWTPKRAAEKPTVTRWAGWSVAQSRMTAVGLE